MEKNNATTESNDILEERPKIKLYFDTLKVTVAQKWCPRDLIEGKKSKTLRAHVKNQQICFLWQGGVTPS